MTLGIYWKRGSHNHKALQELCSIWVGCLSENWTSNRTEPAIDELHLVLLGSFGELNIIATTHCSGSDDLFLILKLKTLSAFHLDLHFCLYTHTLKPDRNSLYYCIITMDNQDLCSRTACLDAYQWVCK